MRGLKNLMLYSIKIIYCYSTWVVYFHCEKCRKLFSDFIMSDQVGRVLLVLCQDLVQIKMKIEFTR